MYVEQGGEYRLQPFKLNPQPLCRAINNDPFFIPEFVKVINYTYPIPCPTPPNVSKIFQCWKILTFLKSSFYVNGYQIKLPPGLMVASQSGDYAGSAVITDKTGKVVYTGWAYIRVVRV